MPFVKIESVSKMYGQGGEESGSCVLSDISLDIPEGEFVCLMGPSGSGKTTLLTVVGAMTRPPRGRVFIDGIDVYSLSTERRADFRAQYL